MNDSRSMARYREHLARLVTMSAEDERSLFASYRSGDVAAGKEILARSQRWIARIARRYSPTGRDREDFVQEANVHAIAAMRAFDPSRTRWATFGALCVSRAMQEYATQQCHIVRAPTAIWRVALATSRGETDVSAVATRARITERRAGHIMRHVAARDVAFSDDAGTATTCTPFDDVATAERILAVRGALDALSDRERDIVRRRHYDGETLDAIGETYGISGERVRQLEIRAIEKLGKRLAGFKEAA